MSRRPGNLQLTDKDVLEISAADARRDGIADGDRLSIESRYGQTEITARISSRMSPGQLFATFHFPETHTNRVTSPVLNPQSRCSEYKITAVCLRQA
jgi:predicted molibdopterin-dependent oxidoreductase YjgC